VNGTDSMSNQNITWVGKSCSNIKSLAKCQFPILFNFYN